MRVLELWRFPVKSMQGERLTSADIGPDGIDGDRRWALVDLATDSERTPRHAPGRLFPGARLRPDGEVDVVLPDGTVTSDDALLSAWLGRRVELRRAAAGAPFHDDPAWRLWLLSPGTLGAWDQRRFRANVPLDDSGEEGLLGPRSGLGSAVVGVE